jgi:thiol-disulfide isomerase/thioredoxin
MKTRFIYLLGVIIGLLVLLRFIQRSKEGFQNDIAGAADTFTLYYAEWCPHCKTVKPAFTDWAKNGFVTAAGKNVKVRMVEQSEKPEEIAAKGIKGFPTFLLETADGKKVEFQGDRTPEGYLKFLEEQLQLTRAQTA